MRFRALGPVRVLTGDGKESHIGGRRQVVLLATLLVHANSFVSIDRMVESVWGENVPKDPARTIQVYLSRLRKVVGNDCLVSAHSGSQLRVDSASFDVIAFEDHVARGRQAADSERLEVAVGLFRNGLSMWRGRPYDDVGYESFLQVEINRLEELRSETLEDLMEAELGRQNQREVVAELEALAHSNPLRERFQAQLMVSLYRMGRQADALGVYKRTRDQLVEELGIEPSPMLQDLEIRILSQDPALNDEIRLGPRERGGSTIVSTRSSSDSASAYLVIGDQRMPITRAVTTIGRSPDSQIMLADQEVSRNHAEIRRVGGTYTLVDRASLNGTLVNGEEVSERVLSDGDLLRIGETDLTFSTDAETFGGEGRAAV